MPVLLLKTIHIIGVVTWFAGLFYIVRLFIYHAEALSRPESEKKILLDQFAIMQKRLWYGIAWPSAIITMVSGLWLTFTIYGYRFDPWLITKLGMVFLLLVYHLVCHNLFSKQQQGLKTWSSYHLRLWNELATLFLIGIVTLVVYKNGLNMLGTGLVILFLAVLFWAIIRRQKGGK